MKQEEYSPLQETIDRLPPPRETKDIESVAVTPDNSNDGKTDKQSPITHFGGKI